MEDLKKIFETKYSRSDWQTILKEYFGTKVIYEKPIPVEIKNNDYKATAVELGSFETEEKYIIGIYEIDLPTNKVNLFRNKKTIRDLLSLKYKNDVDGALVVFKQDSTNKWRFSYVTELKQNATHWKRYTYLLGEGERCKTASDRFEKIKAITKSKNDLPIQALSDAFSVEKMSIEFFDTYRKHYGKFTTYLTGEDENGKKAGASRVMSGFAAFFPNEQEVAKKNARDFVKKMMGRIVFLYFLEKKGWLGVPETGDWGEGDEFFMSNLIKDAKNPSIFYSEVLVPLFFDTLNNPRPDDLFKIKASVFKTIEFNKLKIPYLNGGLFEEDAKALRNLVLPEKLFYNPKATSEDEFGLFQFLDQYNFTVDEDSKLDHTVAVDPEMMGHIFENLLEDNKENGTFYTPKAIVEYMCQESLLEYLSTKLKADDDLRKKLDVLIRVEGDGMEPLLEHLASIVKALKEVKICDPAIGSGAFPMGMLMEIYHIMEKLSTYKIARDAWPIQQWDKDSHKIKLNVIQNNIYGVDIEKGAVDIARLRFWLSLIVDLEKPQALPNLDYKIVQGNSLLNELHINSNYKINVDIDWDIDGKGTVASTKQLMEHIAKDLKTLKDKQKQYFEPSSDKKNVNQQIRDLKIDILTNQIELDKILYSNSAKGLKQAKLFGDEVEQVDLFKDAKKEKQEEENRKLKLESYNEALKHLKDLKKHPNKPLRFFNYELDFAEVMNPTINDNAGFDIVIANPPYVDYRLIDSAITSNYNYPINKSSSRPNLYQYFVELSDNLISNTGAFCFINPNQFLSTDNGFKLREHLITKRHIKFIVDVSYIKVFKDAATYPIVWLFKKDKESQIRINRCSEIEDLGKTSFFINQLDIKNTDSKIIPINIEYFALSKIEKGKRTLGDICKLKWGTSATGYGQMKIDKEVFDKLSASKQKLYKPILQTSDTKKYYIDWQEEYIPVAIYSKAIIQEFNKTKIVIGRVTKKIQACFDDDKCYVGKSTVITDSEMNLKLLLALLNSAFANRWYYLKFETTHMAGGYLRYDIPYLEKLPLPNITSLTESKLISLVDQIIIKKSKSKTASTVDLEQKIDNLVYKLYEIEYEAVKVIDPEFTLTKEEYEAIEL